MQVWFRSVVISAILFTLYQLSLMSKVMGLHEKINTHTQVVKPVKRDYYEEFQRAKKTRNCFGEYGKEAKLLPPDWEKGNELLKKTGINTLVSDRVPLDRTLPDFRHEG